MTFPYYTPAYAIILLLIIYCLRLNNKLENETRVNLLSFVELKTYLQSTLSGCFLMIEKVNSRVSDNTPSRILVGPTHSVSKDVEHVVYHRAISASPLCDDGDHTTKPCMCYKTYEWAQGSNPTNTLRYSSQEDINQFKHCKKLRTFEITGNNITDLSFLSSLTELRCVKLNGCKRISDISPLASLVNLEHLDIRNIAVHDVSTLPTISSLSSLTKLKSLYIGSTDVDSSFTSVKNPKRVETKRASKILNIPDLEIYEDGD